MATAATALKITNTLTKKKETVLPLQPKKINMYVCGITPYDYAHLGHGRCYITFDVLYRLLGFLGYEVTYCRNFTDIDDKLLHRAQQELGDQMRYNEIAQRYIDAYTQDMERLQCKVPQYQPRVTEVIPEIIAFVQGLIDAGKAYVVGNDVYFSICSFAQYGALSGHKQEDLCAGVRVEVNEQKRNPLDFVLWKGNEEGLFWKSPWGYGRPGWHIECSAMAEKFLGKELDIHGGGMDLIFPHHENEKAQSEALFEEPFVKYWVHNGFVRINQEKMSKSLGNFFTLRDLFAKFDPMVIRYYLLTHHYRAPLDFSLDDVATAQKAYNRLCIALAGCNTREPASLEKIKSSVVADKMIVFLCDDLNTPGMFGVVFENLADIVKNPKESQAVYCILTQVLGLALIPIPEIVIAVTPQMQQLLDERVVARQKRDWARADAIREELKKLGYIPKDDKL